MFSRKKKAIAFVDYEYWFYSYRTRFGITPDPAKWIEDVKTTYNIEQVWVFGDFSNPMLREEVGKIRCITNDIIETGNTYHSKKKDMTDFVMLDYIYRAADENKRVRTYLIFTGDGHFQSVVKYLTEKKKKKVVLCGICDSMSRQLQAVATELRLYPAEDTHSCDCAKMIISNMAYVADKESIVPTFWGTVEAVSRYNNVPQEDVVAALKKMLDEGYLVRKERYLQYGKKVMVISPDWDKMVKDGLWKP